MDSSTALEALDLGPLPSPSSAARDLQSFSLSLEPSYLRNSLPSWQHHWVSSRKQLLPDPASHLRTHKSHTRTVFDWKWSGLNGPVSGYSEKTVVHDPDLNAASSTSVNRDPSDQLTFVRGSSSHVPFAPGGLGSEVVSGEETLPSSTIDLDPSQLRTIPPGFDRGLLFDTDSTELNDFISSSNVSAPSVTSYHATGQSRPVHEQNKQAGALIDAEVSELLPDHRLRIGGMRSTAESSRKHNVSAKKDWAHVVDVNKDFKNFRQLVPDMAREYPFELDTFQKEAVYHLENGHSVFVAAHTSAGKTVVAEYAIALAASHLTRAIYTSPIKALSNQKFRDFKNEFGQENVGILTGDVQINPSAPCLVMTTEILRSMLYKGADLIRDVEWVIFDEVHYVNDAERGVVWEEVIILLPEHVNVILLSATVPNAKEFADWVGRTKKKDIYVITTPKRPVPLEHYLYAGREMFKIVDSSGNFLSAGHKDAAESLRKKQDKEREAAGLPPISSSGGTRGKDPRGGGNQRGGKGRGNTTENRGRGTENGNRGRGNTKDSRGRGGSGGFSMVRGSGGQASRAQRDTTLWVHLIGMLRKRQLLPVVAFTFSKKRCEENSLSLPLTIDLCNASEKSEVHVIIEKSLTRLKDEDKKLPQILRIRNLLSRGIAVHHGGLLPIVKEMVEILFARGLVKVLFATETFAMGVNMPARTVVFSHTRKHDGTSFRELVPGEYTQMSGRAGRRGLDATGIVIIVSSDNEPPDVASLQKMILGVPGKLQSQFRLTYSMILNLLRVEALKVEEMIKRSFSENASQRLLPEQQKQVVAKEKELAALPTVDESLPRWKKANEHYSLVQQMNEIQTRLVRYVTQETRDSKVFHGGRIVILNDGHFQSLPAVILRGPYPNPDKPSSDESSFVVLAFGPARELNETNDIPPEVMLPVWPPKLRTPDDNWTYELAEVPDTSIALATKHHIKVDAVQIIDFNRKGKMKTALKSTLPLVEEIIQQQEKGGNIQVKENEWTKSRSITFHDIMKDRNHYSQKLTMVQKELEDMTDDGNDAVALDLLVHKRKLILKNIEDLRSALSDLNLDLLPDYEQRIDVLQRLEFIDVKSTVLLKGRVACEIDTANELILTELVLEDVLSGYEPAEIVSLFSCLVFQEKNDSEPELNDRLTEGKEKLKEIAERVEKIQSECRANVKEDFGTQLNFGLMQAVYEWALGVPFEKVTRLTDAQEGTIVRAITRIDECCREVQDAARVIGDSTLHQKMEACQLAIRRDVVFCASL